MYHSQDKISSLTIQMRRLWPKYDTELNQAIYGMETVLTLYQHFFKEAKLSDDLEVFMTQEQDSLEELIYRQAGVDPN